MSKTGTGRGKQPNQKLKPYIVLQCLLRDSDADNVLSATTLVEYLSDECGIAAERRSIYRDIEEINLVALMMEEECTVDEAAEMLEDDPYDELKLVVYDKTKKGFYVRQRHYDLNDIRLLAECVYAAKFVSEGQAKRLVDVLSEFVSIHQADRIKHSVYLTDRVKTTNKSVYSIVSLLNDAMSTAIDGEPHEPEKITFKYLKYSINDMGQQVERRHGAKYTVSPYQLLINDGHYYLLAYDDRAKDMRTYRVDRMKEVDFTGEPREGEEEFRKIDFRTYTQRVFSMYGGEQKHVRLRFINPLLDTVVEKFGTKNASYCKTDDKKHFTVATDVEISDQFFGWLLGFGKRVKIVSPSDVMEQFKAYLDKIRGMY